MTRILGMRIIFKDEEFIKQFITAKSKLWMDSKISDTNKAYAEYCIREQTKKILEEY